MNKPLLTIDVAKNYSVAATYLFLHEPLDKPWIVNTMRLKKTLWDIYNLSSRREPGRKKLT